MNTTDAWWLGGQRRRLVAPRAYRGNMCGIHVPGLPAIEGGPTDPSLVVSWIVFRYAAADRQRIFAKWTEAGCKDVLVSWPDARVAGLSPEQFTAHCLELADAGFLPAHMLASKDFDPPDTDEIKRRISEVLPWLMRAGVAPRVCPAWEASLWLSPTQLQDLIDWLAPQVVPHESKMYLHLQQGYSTFGQPGETFAAFWNRNIGKLTGSWHQKILTQDRMRYYYDSGGLVDVLQRFAGNYGVSTDSGFGHPFDLIALEITAAEQFDGSCSEADGNDLGRWALACPTQSGPAGLVGVMGSGNGF